MLMLAPTLTCCMCIVSNFLVVWPNFFSPLAAYLSLL